MAGPGLFYWDALLAPKIFLIPPLILATVVSAFIVQQLGPQDPEWIVIDEFLGMWWGFLFLPPGLGAWGLLLFFGLFRLLDVAKPWPIGRIDEHKNGWAIMGDDLVAGALAGVIIGQSYNFLS